MQRMKLKILAAALFFILPGLSFISADVYKWTDENGGTHFGNRPPSDGRNVKILFKEIPSDSGAGQTNSGTPSDTEAIIKELDSEQQREQQEARRQEEEARQEKPLSREEIINHERQRLEKKIADLEAAPLSDFGSQKNKRVRIGFYQYRLETLLSDPDAYFSNPETFEGNVKKPEKKSSN
jgi:hypothetical protein